MAELTIKEKEDEDGETEGLAAMEKEGLSRKEKRKALKKAKRKQARRERAAKERLEAEARLNDPAEQARLSLAEQEEAERSRRERAEFEARERAWLAAMEESQRRKALEEEEERRRKALDEEASRMSQQVENANEGNESDGDWEYVEEGPPEIIWQGNEIILKKKKIRVSKKKEPHESDESNKNVDAERPISNPFPPESEAFAEYRNSSATGQDLIGSVALLQVPNFGTEQDKAHCPFHLKTGVCRFGQRCSRVHFYPDKSCTLLIKNMYNGPGLAWEQDEGLENYVYSPEVLGFSNGSVEIKDVRIVILEFLNILGVWSCLDDDGYNFQRYTDEEVERCYEEFYEDVHTEFLKFGEIINFKVCRNGSFHLRGNVYVHFKSLDSAVLAYHSVNGRYFAGKQVSCEFVNVTRWKVAICGEYTKTRFKTCSRGTACNFIHCFRNPGCDYEWADSDKPPPRYWAKKMIALFGYSDDSSNERQTVQGNLDQPNSSGKISSADAESTCNFGYRSRRSRSREKDYLHRSSSTRKNDNSLDDNIPAKRKNDNKDYVQRRRYQLRCRNDDKDKINTLDEDVHEDGMKFKDGLRRKRKTHDTDTGESFDDDRERRLDGYHDRARKSSRWNSRDSKDGFHDLGFNGDWLAGEGEKERGYDYTSKSTKYQRAEKLGDYEDHERENCEVNRDWRGRGRDEAGYHDGRKNTPRRSRKARNLSDHRDKRRGSRDTDREWSDKDSDGDRHSSRRKSSVSFGNTDNSSDNRGREGYSYGIIGISCEWLDKDRTNKVSDLSNDEGEQVKMLNIRGGHSRKEIIEADSCSKSLRSDRNNDSSCSSKYDEQYRLYNLDSRCSSDLEIGKLDRWEPEKFSERHEKRRRKDSTTSRSPGQYERDKSCDKYSELYHDRHQK